MVPGLKMDEELRSKNSSCLISPRTLRLIRRLYLLLSFVGLALEFNSLDLFLWPLNYSCARSTTSKATDTAHQPAYPFILRPNISTSTSTSTSISNFTSTYTLSNTSALSTATGTDTSISAYDKKMRNNQTYPKGNFYDFNDSRNHLINQDAIQWNLYDATPEDSFTLARAYSMGINYDDISRCYEYQIIMNNETGIDTRNMESIESCRHGLNFEQKQTGSKISIIAFYQLACSRQYLKILLPCSFSLGILFAILITHYLNCKISNSRQSGGTEMTNEDNQRKYLYYWLLVQILTTLIVQLYSYNLAQVNNKYDNEQSGNKPSLQLFIQLITCILARSFISVSGLMRILGSSSKQHSNKTKLYRDIPFNFVIFCSIIVIHRILYLPLALRIFNDWSHLNEWLTVYSFLFTFLLIIKELILLESNKGYRLAMDTGLSKQLDISQDSIKAYLDESSTTGGNTLSPITGVGLASHNNMMDTSKVCDFCSIYHPQPHQQETGDLVDLPSSLIIDPYAPTTAPVHVGAIKPDRINRKHFNQIQHNFSFTNLVLINRLTICKLMLVTFSLSFNYFLIQMLPDHKLLHSETIASRLKRKIDHNNLDISLHKDISIEKEPDLVKSSSRSNHSKLIKMLYKDTFDYGSVNGATESLDIMQNSMNPLKLLWTTAQLYGWPVELLVLILHLNLISSFEIIYFKLNCLFNLVKFGSKLLILEWIVIAIVKSRNHLFEIDWLHSVAILLAHSGSALILFNFIFTVLKLGNRLMTNKLMEFVQTSICICLAYMLSSLAPLMENIDLAIIPVLIIVNNLLVNQLVYNLGKTFKQCLCPMIFEESSISSRPSSNVVTIEYREPSTTEC